uniref:Peptidase M12B domain-containing protein n=1 Tax=Amblyomma maculatum TaxID=34609 RepID=G3MNC3_AMBMU
MSFLDPHKVAAVVTALFLASAVKGAPKPRLVYPRLLEERAADGAKLVHVHEGLTLSLLKASVAASTLAVHEFENGKSTVRFIRGKDIDGNLYEDEKHLATVAVRAEYDAFELEGVIGPRHRIAPAPMMERSEEGHLPHLIYEIVENEGAKYDALLPKKDEATLIRERQYNPFQRVPAEVIIELFIISDKIHQKRFDKTERLLGYLCVMVNSANLRYKDTVSPRVKLLLVGLQRSQHEPYFHGDDKYMDDTATIQSLIQYVQLKRREYGYPDAVYLMTGRDMYALDNGVPDTSRKGLAFVTGVCTASMVAIGEDTPGSYNGMHALTHETAHLLGAAHDGDPPMTELAPGHPGALGCPFSQGYIMSYVNNGPNYHRFSSCSIKQIQFVLRLRGLACWQVRSKGHTLDGYYPGMLVKPIDLCSRLTSFSSVKCDVMSSSPIHTATGAVYMRTLKLMTSQVVARGKVCVRGICGRKP